MAIGGMGAACECPGRARPGVRTSMGVDLPSRTGVEISPRYQLYPSYREFLC